MRFSGDWVQRSVAAWLALLLAVPFGEAATTRVRLIAPAQQTAGASSGRPQGETADTKAAATTPAQAVASPGSSGAGQQTATPPQAPAAAPPQQQQNSTVPVGTAAAPYLKALGVPASRPAGAAIAPAKQKRAHSFLIKIGVIVGAAIAVGAVVGLSKTAPSRPN